jgi:diguanylate cyclase (GGDEF)-like protein/PAS domain S-box-containing protein
MMLPFRNHGRGWAGIGLQGRLLLPFLVATLLTGVIGCHILLSEELGEAEVRIERALRLVPGFLAPVIVERMGSGIEGAVDSVLQEQLLLLEDFVLIQWDYMGETASAKRSEGGAPSWFADRMGFGVREKVSPLILDGRVYGELHLVANGGVSTERAWLRFWSFAKIGGLLGGSLLISILLMLRHTVSSLRHTVSGVQALADGRFDIRVTASGAAESRELAQAFNRVAGKVGQLVSSLRETEQSLRQEKERAEVTLASIADAVVTTDAEGRVVFVNGTAETLIGQDGGKLFGCPIEDVFSIKDEQSGNWLANPVRRVLGGERVVDTLCKTMLHAHDGRECAIEHSVSPILDSHGRMNGCVVVFRDVSNQRRMLENINWQVGHDALTGLPNRVLLADRFQLALAVAARQNKLLAVCFVDLDEFKPINDRLGHHFGDDLLVQVAERLEEAMRAEDTVARLGGDEFVLLLGNMDDTASIERALGRLLDCVAAPYDINDQTLNISMSVGVAVFPDDGSDPDILLRHADVAMYQAKQAGGNHYHLFEPGQDWLDKSHQQLFAAVQQALVRGEFRLHYQPKVSMRTGKVLGLEALIRWEHPEKGLLGPGEFLPILEENHLIADIGEWVIEEALRQVDEWQRQGVGWPVSVNIAPRHFLQAGFVDYLESVLSRYAEIPKGWLELEILESAAVDDIARMGAIISQCRSLGVGFALDDFGTGYSSLTYLKQFAVNTLKIDRSFVKDMLDNSEELALVEAIVSLAKVFQLNVIAEGVEVDEQGVLLMRMGCDVAQGYAIARPMPASVVPTWVAGYRTSPKWSMWAGNFVDLPDLLLLVAQHDFSGWVRRFIQAIDNRTGESGVDQVEFVETRFRRWYYGPGKSRYGQQTVFQEIEPIYREACALAEMVSHQCRSGEPHVNQAREQLVAFESAIFEKLERLSLVSAINYEAVTGERSSTD